MRITPKGYMLKLAAALVFCLGFVVSPASFSDKAKAQQVIQKIEALVNDEVISAYDVGQRMGLVLLATGQTINSQEQLLQLRNQVLDALINERLQTQEAREYEVPVPDEEIMQTFTRVAQGYNRTPETFAELLEEYGSSPASIIGQIRTEFAWQSLVNGRYGSQAEATDDEVDEVLADMQANAGRREFRLSEIFLIVNNPQEADRVGAAAQRLRDQMTDYAQFSEIARQFSQSTSAAQGGDVGWVSEGQFPDDILQVVDGMDLLEVSQPIKTVGGYYIVGLTDRRKILTNDPLDELLDLRQIGYFFTADTTEDSAMAWYNLAKEEGAKLTSCDELPAMVEKLGEVMFRDLGEIPLKQLNPELRTILSPVAIGHATEPINTPEGFIVFTQCGRRMPEARLPSPEEIQQQIETQRIAMIGRRYLRDLRRDAIIDYK